MKLRELNVLLPYLRKIQDNSFHGFQIVVHKAAVIT